MRSHKHHSNNGGPFFMPTVNSYKLHLAAVKSLIPDRDVQKTFDLQACHELTKNICMDSLKKTPPRLGMPPRTDLRHLAQAGKRPLHAPLLAFVNEQRSPECHLPTPRAAGTSHPPWDQGCQSVRAKPQRHTRSAGASHSHNPLSHHQASGESTAATALDSSLPGFPIAFRSRDDCGTERLDLDRRGLVECPPVVGLEKLRLLNLQHNLLTRVHSLESLRRLVFLDLYDNHISDLTGIACLVSLRVLMLGKNRIQRICHLDNLAKLDVLDMHNNQISQMENLSHLSELRVLNLAGNRISRVQGLQGLDSLMELNLKRNSISSVTEVDRLPCLQRLFLSCNSISSFDELACLGESCSLCELTLDGNPVAEETWYRQAALCLMLHLRLLDMKRITEEDRRMAGVVARREDEKKRETHKQAIHKGSVCSSPQQESSQSEVCRLQEKVQAVEKVQEKRRLAIRNAAQQWEGLKSCLDLPTQNGSKEEVSPENSPTHSSAQTNGIAQDPSPDELRRVSPILALDRPAVITENRLRSISRPNSPRDPRLQDAGSSSVQSLSLSESHLAELDGETLRLFGAGALEALERGWGVQTAAAVTTIAFRYISFDAIVPTLPRIRVKFPNLAHLIFLETNISRLPQLAALAQVRRLDQITVHPEGNPVVGLSVWRSFLLYRLHHFNLQRLNGVEVTINDVIAAERLFGTLGHIAATETPHCRLLLLLEESRKRQLQFLLEGRGRRVGQSPEELRENGRLLGEGLSRALFNYPNRDTCSEGPEEGAAEALAQTYVQGLVQRTAETSAKREAQHKLWPSMFVELVRDCVLEVRGRSGGPQQSYPQACLSRLTHISK
ncbi:leucine-rich repeat-containing protein 49 isoform X3 [Alosa alosa]|uniref:leucine-rich repeat-containing protein 49 isoform X3 n=1 Tax=Alosa alosa TaxID=278164 RepID=UPI002015367F|nr:leucine-rich repeat-containing protein 49 isoform X3 [Alosa alosa]